MTFQSAVSNLQVTSEAVIRKTAMVAGTIPTFASDGQLIDSSVAISSLLTGASVLTGYVSGAGVVSATDTILQAIQKLNGNASALVTGVSSVFGRSGAVVSAINDYTFAQIGSKPTTIVGYGITDTTAQLLTGLNIIGSSILSTDSILSAFGKVQNQINGILGGAIYQGVWNASTNSPTLTSSVGTKGYYYVVSVDGTTNLNGNTDWKLGDWAIFNGATWDKVDNTDAVSSVNGFTGAVSLTTLNVSEATNLYFTNARAIASTLTGYVSTTGVISPADTILSAIQKLNGNIAVSQVAGSNTQIQFNNSGSFGASANFVWDNANTRLGIGGTPLNPLHIQGGVMTLNDIILATGSINDFLEINVQNTSTGTSSQSSLTVTANNGTLTSGFATVGINGSNFTAVNYYSIGVANDTNFMGSGNDMYIANTSTTKDIIFATGLASTPFFTNVLRITNAGAIIGLVTQNLMNTVSTTINFGGVATAINIGATTGTVTINNPTILGSQTTQNLWNTVATTINFGGVATAINIGATTGTVTINNPTILGSQTTQNLWNTVATTVNVFGASTSITLGATTGTLTLRNPTIVATASMTFFNTVTTTLTAFGAVTTSTLFASTGTITLNYGTGATLNATTKTLNFGTAGVSGSTTNINIGSAVSGALGTLTLGSTTIAVSNTTVTFFNTTITTITAYASITTANLFGNTIAQTVNFATGVITTGLTKTINIGTLGASGSTTTISIGSNVVGALGIITLYQDTVVDTGHSLTARIKPRTGTVTSSATPTINTDNVDFYSITALAVDITGVTMTGTPTDGQKIWIAITATATRAITLGPNFEASTIALPITTVGTARLDIGAIWNTVTSKWRVVGVV